MKMELLAPAGSSDAFFSAIDNGANAVYLGVTQFNARNKAENFTLENLSYYINYAHMFGVKVYLTLNTLIKDEEIFDFLETAKAVYNMGIDAVIIQDIGMSALLKNHLPNLNLHLSTQMAVSNYHSASVLKESFNAKRVVLSRECSKEEIEKVTKINDLETEVFVHGALCVALSGYCYFSSLVFSNSGNRGMCLQPCRKKYSCEINGMQKQGYFLSTKDICLLNDINLLKQMGVTSLKIEGRLKSREYVAGVVKAYRKAIDGENLTNKDIEELKLLYNRGDFSKGYVFSNSGIIYNKLQGHKGVFAGEVLSVNKDTAEIKANRNLNNEDGFKVTRNGEEVGSVEITKKLNSNKYLCKFKGKLNKGDGVFITKDTVFLNSLNIPHKKKIVNVSFIAKIGNKPKAILTLDNKQITYELDFILEQSQNYGLTKEDIKTCFNKTDNFPFEIKYSSFDIDNVFLPKSKLNELRRNAFNELFECNTKIDNKEISYKKQEKEIKNYKKPLNAVVVDNANILSSSLNEQIDYCIFKPYEYTQKDVENFINNAKDIENKYLFIPEYIEEKDYNLIENLLENNDLGLALNSFSMLDYAIQNNRKIFALNLNIFNSESVKLLENLGIDNIAISKELKNIEVKNILENANSNIFVNAFGEIDLMYFKHCILRENFDSKCDKCKYNGEITYKDEKGIDFTIKRIKLKNCYFSLKNGRFLNLLKDYKIKNKIINLSGLTKNEAENLIINGTLPLKEYTNGSFIKGVKW